MTDALLVYIFMAVIGVSFALLALPTLINRKRNK